MLLHFCHYVIIVDFRNKISFNCKYTYIARPTTQTALPYVKQTDKISLCQSLQSYIPTQIDQFRQNILDASI